MFKALPKTAIALGLTLALTGCASSIPLLDRFNGKPEQAMQVEVPENAKGVGMKQVQNEAWWLLLGDPALNQVVEQALQNNTDVRLANERLNEAGAVLGIAKSQQWPSIFGQFTTGRNRPSQAGNVPVFGVLGTSPPQITLRPETRAWQGFQEDPTFSVSQIHRSTGLRSPSY